MSIDTIRWHQKKKIKTHAQVSSPKYVNKKPTRFACPHAAHHQALTIDDMGVGFFIYYFLFNNSKREKQNEPSNWDITKYCDKCWFLSFHPIYIHRGLKSSVLFSFFFLWTSKHIMLRSCQWTCKWKKSVTGLPSEEPMWKLANRSNPAGVTLKGFLLEPSKWMELIMSKSWSKRPPRKQSKCDCNEKSCKALWKLKSTLHAALRSECQ